MGRPGEVFGKAGGVQPVDQAAQAAQVIAVERALPADGQADAMDRDGEAFGQGAKLGQRPAAVAHVVLGMDLDPADGAGGLGEPAKCRDL
jgi:hypothetical protein